MAKQLALDLGTPVAPPATVVSRSNEDAYRLLSEWPRWPHPIMLVTGPAGAGKSHLAARFGEAVGSPVHTGSRLSADGVLDLVAAPMVVDDADAADDRVLFHLINAVRNAGTTLLLTATSRRVGGLADLDSRLRAVPEVAMDPPDDALLRQVIIEGFQARQLPAEPAVVNFLMSRIERTLHDAVHWVNMLDKEGLAQKRGPTRPLASRLLKAEGGSPFDDSVP